MVRVSHRVVLKWHMKVFNEIIDFVILFGVQEWSGTMCIYMSINIEKIKKIHGSTGSLTLVLK